MRRVLIADDNRISRELIRDVLEPLELEVHEASDGLQAIEILSFGDMDLVFLDIEMPVRDGYQVLDHIQRHALLPGNRVWAVSANAMESARQRALAAGFGAYITKPIVPCEFRGEVEKAIHGQT
jgi:CheY-like chemotaxis protein